MFLVWCSLKIDSYFFAIKPYGFIEILNKTPLFTYNFHNKYFILFTFSLALEWSEDQNRLSVREVLITVPYRFKARTTERGKVWQQIADNPNSDHTLKFPSKKFGGF